MKILKAFIVLLILSNISCKKEDTEKPVIDMTAPTAGQEIERGSSFKLKGTVTDNENLSQYKIDIHHGGDGHTHKTTTEAFDFEKIENIEGAEYNIDLSVTVPADAEHGEYHVIVDATDEAGNEAETVEIGIAVHED